MANGGELAEPAALLDLLAEGAVRTASPTGGFRRLELRSVRFGGAETLILGDSIIPSGGETPGEPIPRALCARRRDELMLARRSRDEGKAEAAIDFVRRRLGASAAWSSGDKADIFILDAESPEDAPHEGYSIKAFDMGLPTLLNASGATTIRYRNLLDPCSAPAAPLRPQGKGISIRDALATLHRCAMPERPWDVSYERETFRNNLLLSGADFDEAFAAALRIAMKTGKTRVSALAIDVALELEFPRRFMEEAFRTFLTGCLRGMLPAVPWDGKGDADGGLLLAAAHGEGAGTALIRAKDGDVLADFLYEAARFERGSGNRYPPDPAFPPNDPAFSLTAQIRLALPKR